MTELAFISLGSNIDPEENLLQAVRCLRALGELRAVSEVYQNPAVGPVSQDDFLNAAILIETGLRASTLRERLRAFEADMGRERMESLAGYPPEAAKYAPRTIDLDLCMLGDLVLEAPPVTLPDPDVLTKPHLAIPLAELAPDFPHPITGEPLQEIADRLLPGAQLTPRPDISIRLQDLV
jgi:2-amino-4-hydroxy-6-hydroxymethyldihydropteridine diphosphokinase